MCNYNKNDGSIVARHVVPNSITVLWRHVQQRASQPASLEPRTSIDVKSSLEMHYAADDDETMHITPAAADAAALAEKNPF